MGKLSRETPPPREGEPMGARSHGALPTICFFGVFFLRCFSILCYASGVYMLLFFRQMFLTRARARVCVCVVHWHCLLVGCLTSQQQASVSQGRICSDNFTVLTL